MVEEGKQVAVVVIDFVYVVTYVRDVCVGWGRWRSGGESNVGWGSWRSGGEGVKVLISASQSLKANII